MHEASTLEVQASMTTRSGSVYRVARDDDGRWWMAADNVPNPTSCRLDPDRWWRIRRPEPWPPELGTSMVLLPPKRFALDDPRRLPGGGKWTTPVRVIRRSAERPRP